VATSFFPRTLEPLTKNTLLFFETSGPVNLTSWCDFPEEQNFRYKHLNIIRCPKTFFRFWTPDTCRTGCVCTFGYNGEPGPNDKEWRHKCKNFTFLLPCIVIDFFLNNQPDALIIQIYCVTKLYMFWASSLPIIRSSLLYIRQFPSTVMMFHPDCAWERSSKTCMKLTSAECTVENS
jgi:hypothetical protein